MTEPKYAPDWIEDLAMNEVFVFGSNLAGRHGKGAALLARRKFGAIPGKGRGLQGQSYALPTKDAELDVLLPCEIHEYIVEFIIFAKLNPELTFLVTKVGCGEAKYDPKAIGRLFMRERIPSNVRLPKEFWTRKPHDDGS